MIVRGYLRCVAALITGLWVTLGAAIPLGYLFLRGLRSASGGRLGPELLERSGVALGLLAVYGVSAAIGGWAAAWVSSRSWRRLTIFLSVCHVGTWLVVLALRASPFESGLTLGLAAAAVLGTVAGVSARFRQIRGRSAVPVGGAGAAAGEEGAV